MIDDLINNILFCSFISSVLAIFLVFLRKMITRYCGAVFLYYSWFSLFLPWIIITLPKRFLFFYHGEMQSLIKPLNRAANCIPQYTDFISSHVLFFIWLVGIVITVFYIVLNHTLFVLRLKCHSRIIENDEQESVKKLLYSNQYSYLKSIQLSSIITSPLIAGFFKTKIYLPNSFFKNYHTSEQKYAIQHELIHLTRYDLFANVFMLWLSSLNWFNPIFFWVYRQFRIAQELSCDAVLTKKLSSKEKQEYGHALLKTAIESSINISVISCQWKMASQLRERCQMLKFHQSKKMKTILGVGLFISIACTAVALPVIKNGLVESSVREMIFSADHIQYFSNSHTMLLTDQVNVSVNHQTNLLADKMITTKHESEILIHGKGVLQNANHRIPFQDGVFNAKTQQLTANFT